MTAPKHLSLRVMRKILMQKFRNHDLSSLNTGLRQKIKRKTLTKMLSPYAEVLLERQLSDGPH
jgi:hypothetical protein